MQISYRMVCNAHVQQLTVSLFSRGGKVRLIQLLDYLSVACPEYGFSLTGQETKRYLELSHDWLPLWWSDFRKKIPRADEFHHDV